VQLLSFVQALLAKQNLNISIMVKIISSLTILLFLSISVFSQTENQSQKEDEFDDEKEIEKIIFQVFDGMRLGDSSMVRACFYDNVELYTSFKNRKGDSILKKGNLEEFLKAVGSPHEEVWDEKLWDMEIRIDNNLGQVWTKYAFYLDDEFSHCGVDAFHLTKTKSGWKIFHLTDTRQRKDCKMPNFD